ncbi:MAG TPA: M28 family peptidase [Blastocatellia bacterium]|nr:M28 family peptidase [Blastocatellia bacterium]
MNSRKILLLVLSTAFLVAAASPSFRPASAALDPGAQSAATAGDLSSERIRAHVQYLASDQLQGRRAGTPAADEAARYIEKEFRSYGLKPAAATGYLQPFTFVARVELGAQNLFQVKAGASEQSYKVGEDFMPLAFSSAEAAAGAAVFIGYGISAPELQYDNYAGADVKGKLVMILRGSPDGDNPHGRFAQFTQPGLEIQNKTLKAREKGARGVIFVSEEKVFQHDRLSRLHHDLNFLDAGIPTVVISRVLANAIIEERKAPQVRSEFTGADAVERAKLRTVPLAIENLTVSFKTDVARINGNAANVVGVLPGSDPRLASEYVVIGAHYDHLGLGGPESLAANPEGEIHHGADDNASGTSALLELARVMAASRGQLKRSVVFAAFSGEELGLLGSAAYTKNPPVPIASTVAMLNMDMVGRLRNQSLFIGGMGTSPVWKPLVEKLNSITWTPATEKGATPGSRFQLSYGQDGFGPSDHQSFYVKDIPVLFFFTNSHDDYHKPSDTADKINAEGIRQVAALVRDIAADVANEPQRIAFTKVKSETKPTSGGFRVYLGTIPNYSDQSDGMKLDGVRPGSPAERAGLKAGDLITRLGKTPVKNVYDYTYALGELRAGEEVEIAIRRDGREMTLKITPEKRQ